MQSVKEPGGDSVRSTTPPAPPFNVRALYDIRPCIPNDLDHRQPPVLVIRVGNEGAAHKVSERATYSSAAPNCDACHTNDLDVVGSLARVARVSTLTRGVRMLLSFHPRQTIPRCPNSIEMMDHHEPLHAVWTDWDDGEEVQINSWQEVEELLDRISKKGGPPCLVEFYVQSTGQSLGIGIGREWTVVTYQASLDPPYYISEGDRVRGSTTWFCSGNEPTEFLARNIIPFAGVCLALKAFFETRTMPTVINWERL